MTPTPHQRQSQFFSTLLWVATWAILLILLASVFGGKADAQSSQQQDIVLLIWDDVGTKDIESLPTPNYDLLAATGAHFVNARAHAWCAPTRDSLFRSVVGGRPRGDLCDASASSAASLGRPSLPSVMRDAGYRTTLVGKYHSGRAGSEGLPWYFAAHALGFDHWLLGLPNSTVGGCNPTGARWSDGVPLMPTGHHTTYQTDAGLGALNEARVEGVPTFIVISYEDAHSPWVQPSGMAMPPSYMPRPNPTQRDLFDAEVIALDHALGRIMSMAAGSRIIVMGDNGTPAAVAPDPTRAKLTVYERGVRIPFVVSGGMGVDPGERDALIQVYDVAPMLAEAVGVPAPADWEGTSFLQSILGVGVFPRDWVYVHHGSPASIRRAVVGEQYKLLIHDDGVEQLFDLWDDPDELVVLPAVGADADYLRQFINQ